MHMQGHPTARVLVLLGGTLAAAASAQQEPTPPAPPPAQQEPAPPVRHEETPASERVQVIGVSPLPGVNVPGRSHPGQRSVGTCG